MKINQSTIEKLAWWIVVLVLILDVATFSKLTLDDNKKFRILKDNQNTLICIVKGFNDPMNHAKHTDFIDTCVKENK